MAGETETPGSQTRNSGLSFGLRSANRQNANSAEYANCIRHAIITIRNVRDYTTYHNTSWAETHPRRATKHLQSGVGKGAALIDFGPILHGPDNYDVYKVWGRNADLFKTKIIDNDSNASNGYELEVQTRRPIPKGTYRFNFEAWYYTETICDFRLDDDYTIVTVEVTAPPGTVHEAFFDPATTTAGVGYSAGSATTTGVLKPAGSR